MDVLSPVVNSVSSYKDLRDYCKEKYPKYNSHKCAFVYLYAKPWEEYNKQLDEDHSAVVDPRSHYDPKNIDINTDDYFEADGEFYNDLFHYEAVESEKMIATMNKAMRKLD